MPAFRCQFKAADTIAARIARYAEALGYTVARDGSAISASQYVACALEDDSIKVRVSDHDPRPSYDDADLDVDTGTGRAMGGSWAASVRHLAARASRPVPPAAARVLAQQAAAAELRRAQDREAGLRAIARQADADRSSALAAARYPAEWAAALALVSGPDRREAKRLLRRRVEAEAAP